MASSSAAPAPAPAAEESSSPPRSALVLLALVTGAIVANINLSIANVALPTIGADLGATQDQLTQVADAFALGLAATVLYLGSIGDRYGRKLLFVLGAILTIPTAMLAAWAPNPEVLILARFASGVAAALLFPTTLSLISALYRGNARVKAIALWSGLGAGVAAIAPVLGGWMLQSFWWGSVFLITLPLVVVALLVGLWVLPWHASEEVFPVDHIGGVLSVIGVGGLVITIQKVDNGITASWVASVVISLLAIAAFLWRQTKAPRPLVDLKLAKARTFWVAFVAGAVTFGSLIGVMFVGQQFTQNVLAYDPLKAAAVVVPAAVFMALMGQVAGRLVTSRGSRFSFGIGLVIVAIAFVTILATWRGDANIAWVLIAYSLIGAGVGLCVTPASRSLMSSVPPVRGGMGSAFLDLTRDFGGAIMQAVMGALLAGAYAYRIAGDLAGSPEASKVSQETADALSSSFQSAEQVAQQYPQYATQITSAASDAFTSGMNAAVLVALAMTLIGLALVLFVYPRKAAEEAYYAEVAATNPDPVDAGASA